ncbi:hypothetical protein CFOL_v3_12288 [Cephalotus follicularis]|uniref:Uncharacterized protein n=1 Tax=Cephalotus follicularis TaxID=3775 RepID=A0A1Q3BLD8_CEPFO|nr:hypothetical protein CFOL_v3_12288 [Cephalotus follicularis]
MFDEVMRTLADVRHMPYLRKNLISLGTMDSRGCKVGIEGGVIRVTKRALIKLQGRMIENLYRLVRTVQTCEGSIISQESVTIEGRGYKIVRPEVGCRSKKKQVMFASNIECGIFLSDRKGEVEPHRTS